MNALVLKTRVPQGTAGSNPALSANGKPLEHRQSEQEVSFGEAGFEFDILFIMKYVALLRGINVGGNNKVSMTKLKDCFERLDFKDVSTYINSGNVIFETTLKTETAIVKKIEEAIVETFKFPVRVVIRSQENIKKIAAAIPKSWENNDKQKSDILFLWEKYKSKKSLGLIEAKTGIDALKYSDGAIFWNVDRKNYTKSGMGNFIGTELYKNMTARNVNTVRKLAALMES